MAIILVMRDRMQLEIQGYEAEAEHVMKAKRPVSVKARKNGRAVIVRGQDILFAEVITAAEELGQAVQAKMKAETEAKKNPNPGRDPKLTPPGEMHEARKAEEAAEMNRKKGNA